MFLCVTCQWLQWEAEKSQREEERKKQKLEVEAAAHKAKLAAAKQKEEEEKVPFAVLFPAFVALRLVTRRVLQLAELQKKGLAPKGSAAAGARPGTAAVALPPAVVR